MSHAPAPAARPVLMARIFALLSAPAIVIFLSSNFVNAGNMGFNVLFSRWMGPELFGDLALILKIKLSILGVLGAVQMSASQLGADDEGAMRPALARINWVAFAILWLELPILAAFLYLTNAGDAVGLGKPILLFILLGSLPFAAPLSLLRWYAFGQGFTGRIVLAANVEMGVRLAGAVFVWKIVLVIEGVIIAIALSIVAGWATLAYIFTIAPPRLPSASGLARTLGRAAFPFAVLQLSQVICLDGEIFLASAFLAPRGACYIAALSLFLRIEFFACFALASVLLPSVIRAAGSKARVIRSAAPVGVLYLLVAAPFLLAV